MNKKELEDYYKFKESWEDYERFKDNLQNLGPDEYEEAVRKYCKKNKL